MKIQENISLNKYTTLQVGGQAHYFCVVKNEADLCEAMTFIKSRKLPFFILGGGSNLLIPDHGFSGLIIKNEIKGIKFTDTRTDKVVLEVGAGENLDDIINLSVIRKLSGLENLSGIPGTAGGAVTQNAGAYGVEMKDCLYQVEGINILNGKRFSFKNRECQFKYRDSLFKKNKKYIITTVYFSLSKLVNSKLSYAGLKDRLTFEKEITAQLIRDTILQIRKDKLPDWHKVGTAGSFFKNPIVTKEKYEELKKKYGELPGFPEVKNNIKISLAWILDNVCDLKGYKEGNIGLYEKQPLILVNFGKGTEKEIKNFSEKIKKIVKEKIGIEIEEEVEKIK